MNQAAEIRDIQIQGHGLFPTPVIQAELPNPEGTNAALRTAIEGRMASHPSTAHSNLGGWQSSWDLAVWGGDGAKVVLDQAKAIAARMTCDRQGKPVKVDWQLNAWANVNSSGHGNEFHTHPGSFWSGTYYVDDGGIDENPGLGGEFEIQDPRGIAPAMYAPLLAINVPGGLAMGSSEVIPPKAGRILMFPSWLSHAVRPYLGTQRRISIAFNLSV
jgi:uncharacterized protein (TIGR02466 family)